MADFSYLQFLRIHGNAEDETETMQGIRSQLVSSGDISQGTEEGETNVNVTFSPQDITVSLSQEGEGAPEFSQQIWEGQQEVLKAEIKYIAQIQKQIKQKKTSVSSSKSQVIEIFKEGIEETLGAVIVGYMVAHGAGMLAPYVSFLVEIGVGYVLDSLELQLTEGNALLEGIAKESQALLGAGKSASAYALRNETMLRHSAQIDQVLRRINEAETALRKETSGGGASSGGVEAVLKKAFLTQTEAAEGETSEMIGFLDERLADLAQQEQSLKIGDMEINTKGRYIQHGNV